MEASGWAEYGMGRGEAKMLLGQADTIACSLSRDPDVRDDLRQEALCQALKCLSNPPDRMPTSGSARLRWLKTPMWQAANKFNSRKAFDTPLGHDGRPHPNMHMTELHSD